MFAYQNGNRYEGQWLDDKRHGRGQFICQLDELHRKLGFYSPEDGYGIHVRYRLCLESSTH